MSKINPTGYIELVRDLRRGETLDELSEELADLQQRCKQTGKVGEIILKIKLRPEKGMDGMFNVTDEIKVKKPEFDRGATVFFEHKDLQLRREDPRQQKLELREAPSEEQEVREAPKSSTQIRQVAK
ncbi:hypothetical protein LMG33818_000009 [Halomonadaceae bacterium LMG 33818]|uniref:hypothetical protein n=1 Tax=Cernens ardua TaxID=3402176 RepID=UPI003EDBADB5